MKNNTVLYLAKGDKKESALLKRRAIADYFGQATLEYLENGKPVITDPKGFGISVSHSGGILALVIAKGDVGLDIQEINDRDNFRILSFFHESERDCDFYDMWTKKEAYGKLTGDGVFLQKGKKLPAGLNFTDISAELSEFSGKRFYGKICGGERKFSVIYLNFTEM